MDARFERALARWPNVPALFGWLRLSQRGQWLIRDSSISNQRITEVINRNYDHDEHGRWFFQNGPQRGYVALDYAPFVLFAESSGGLTTHTGLVVTEIIQALLDETGGLVLATEHGAGLLSDRDLTWALTRLQTTGSNLEDALTTALTEPSGETTALRLGALGDEHTLQRCDTNAIPRELGFVRDPEPFPDEAKAGG